MTARCGWLGAVVVALLLLAAGPVAADMTVADFVRYEKEAGGRLKGAEALPTDEVAYLEGILAGMAWGNYHMILRRDPPLFCVPGYLVVSADMAIPMIRAYIRKNLGEEAAAESQVPLVMVLIDSMKATFPCKNGAWIYGGRRTVD